MTLNTAIATETVTSPARGHAKAVGFAFGTTTLGEVLVATTSKGICAIFLGSSRERLIAELRRYFPDAEASQDKLAEDVTRVVSLIESPARPVDLTLDLQGSDFEIRVWERLRAIPPGKTLSYSELAERLDIKTGAKGPAKDVADAVAANRIAVAVPCHRILRKDGTISGYRWGVHRKRALLEREGVR